MHDTHMGLALHEATAALKAGEVPVGCVFVHPVVGVIGRGHNNTVASCNATRHAELEAIDAMLMCAPWRPFECKPVWAWSSSAGCRAVSPAGSAVS